MTARGVKFLEGWVNINVPPLKFTGDGLIRALAQKLKDDASASGFTIEDLEIGGPQVEPFIRKTIGQIAEPETQTD